MRRFLFTLLLAGISSQALAIVNMDQLHTLQPTQGFSGGLDLSLSASRGNTDLSEYSLSGRLYHHQPQRYTQFLLLEGDYAESGGKKSNEHYFTHLRHIYHWQPSIDWELFTQLEQDLFARLKLRTLAGSGVRAQLSAGEKRRLVGGLGIFYEWEQIDDNVTDGGDSRLWRANLYLIAKYQFSPQVQLSNTLYYQPQLEASSDYRLIDELSLGVKLSERLELGLHFTSRYDSEPPLQVKTYDTDFKTSLGFRF